MKLYLFVPRGFCGGVVRAIRTVEQSLERWGPPIYVKHAIVHNEYVVHALKEKGAVIVEDLSSVPKGARVVYSAHGVSPCVRKEAREKKIFEIDATCPLVEANHTLVKRYAAEDYHILLIGKKDHVEAIATADEAPDSVTIIERKDDIDSLFFSDGQKLFALAQTTYSVDEVDEIISYIKEKFPQLETSRCLTCYATTNRQRAVRDFSCLVDCVFVVGDPKSSNSNRLKEMAKQIKKAYLIHSPSDIRREWLKDIEVIGMTAGASTPESIVQECVAQLEKFGVTQVEEIGQKEREIKFPLPVILTEEAILDDN